MRYYMSLGLVFSLFISYSADRLYREESWLYIAGIIIRYFAGFYMLSTGYAKIDDNYFNIAIDRYNEVVIDLNAKDIATIFYDHSYGYQAIIGVLEILGAALLFFRNTSLLGSVILTVLLSNALLVNYYYELERGLWTSTMLCLSMYPLFINLPRIIRFWVLNQPLNSVKYPLFNNQKMYNSSILLKAVLIAGPIVMYVWSMERVNDWSRANYEHPAVGAWIIDDVEYITDTLEHKDIPKFERMLFNKGRKGQLITHDTTSGFEYIVDTTYDQFEMYNFYEFRNMDVKGKYVIQSPDTLLFKGTNQKDTLNFTMIRDKRFEKILKPK